jgi:transketolase
MNNLDPYKVAQKIRKRVLELAISRRGGNLSQTCSSAEILATIYTRILNITELKAPLMPKKFAGPPSATNKDSFTGDDYNGIKGPEYDRFYLSPSQYSVVLYATLVEVGRMLPEGFELYGKDGYVIEQIGESHSPGMDINGGSLGQCISQAAGVAMGRKLKGETGRNIVLLGDGELQLGQTWEAVQAMCFYKLDNMVVIVDQNGQQCDGKVSDVMDSPPLEKRFEAFGARVYTVDGHNCDVLASVANQKPDGRPIVIMARTNPCRGIELLEQKAPRLHFISLNDDDVPRYEEHLNRMSSQL